MRGKLRERLSIGTEENPIYINGKNLTVLQSLEVGLRTALRDRKSAKDRRIAMAAKEMQERTERIENLKTTILDKLTSSMSPRENPLLAKYNKTALAVHLSVSRSCEDILQDLLKHQEFSGYKITVFSANPDILKAKPNLPIIIRFEKTLVGEV